MAEPFIDGDEGVPGIIFRQNVNSRAPRALRTAAAHFRVGTIRKAKMSGSCPKVMDFLGMEFARGFFGREKKYLEGVVSDYKHTPRLQQLQKNQYHEFLDLSGFAVRDLSGWTDSRGGSEYV
ncbi:MAG: hypothetical protein LBU43_11570 [Candidatus Accumulibacter sp.]|nr:hypothetical protein [Accumulibacter sp.]